MPPGRLGTIADKIAATKEERDELNVWVSRNFAPEYAKLGPPAAQRLAQTRSSCARNFSNSLSIMATTPLSLPRHEKLPIDTSTIPRPSIQRSARLLSKLLRRTATPCSSTGCKRSMRHRPIPTCRRPHYDCWSSLTIPRCLSAVSSIRSRARYAIRMPQFSSHIGLQDPDTRDATWNFVKTHWDQVHAELTTDLGSYSGCRCRQLLHR